ncbi:MAG: 6-phospho-3-hexuloisomerase [Candidatus Aenigmarchaeota archaeon]|nr:6-phospho-3-hexuloisomerase [Candidatus Aenigmarchaeota archaeon]
MVKVKQLIETLLNTIKKNLRRTREADIQKFLQILLESKRVFVVGAGRSGLVVKSFAMRLMHLGFEVYVVGETITPPIKKDDLLVALSGSGSTSFVVLVARTAKKLGAKVVAITSHPDSPLGKLSDHIVKIGGRGEEFVRDYVSDQLKGFSKSLTPMGTLFELSSSIFLDSVIAALMDIMGKSEEELKKKHTNLE